MGLNFNVNYQGVSSAFFFIEKEFNQKFFEIPSLFIESNLTYYYINELEDKIVKFFKKHKIKDYSTKEFHKYYFNNKNSFISEKIYFFDKTLLSFTVEDFDNLEDLDLGYESPSSLKSKEEAIDFEIERADKNFCKIRIRILSSLEIHNREYLKDFLNEILSTETNKKKIDRECNLIIRDTQGFKLSSFPVNQIDVDISTNYNDDFIKVHDRLLEELNITNSPGLVLLNGIPGSGKTSFLRFLTQKIEKKKIIYIQPDLISYITSPEFVGFMIKNPNSVLVIEDAESILKKRQGDNNSAVSNLLNLSDGILGDLLKLQIICTFNCGVAEIDPALRREGRLLAEYEFKELTIEKTNNLLDKLFVGKDYKSICPLTLSKIYSFEKEHLVNKEKNLKIGFNKH